MMPLQTPSQQEDNYQPHLFHLYDAFPWFSFFFVLLLALLITDYNIDSNGNIHINNIILIKKIKKKL